MGLSVGEVHPPEALSRRNCVPFFFGDGSTSPLSRPSLTFFERMPLEAYIKVEMFIALPLLQL
jgi:hypothetical protein